MTAPKISVAMSVYNGERFLAEAIQSVLIQTFGDFEFLILDDGSTDSSRAIISSAAARDSRVRAISRENRGLIASLNQLLDEARAPYIARMDADDICKPKRFERQVAFLESHPDYGVIGTWTDDIDEDGAPYRITAADLPTTHEAFVQAIENEAPLICHPAVMMRREVVLAAGGYHAAFRHCEDLDLWLRLASMTKLASIPEHLLLYRHYAGQVSSRHAVEQQIGAAIARVAYRERVAGRPDPTAQITTLPPIDTLDTLFARAGVAREVRAMVAQALLYSPVAIRGEGFDLLLRHLAEGGSREGMWRTVARLIRLGEPLRAARLTYALLRMTPGQSSEQAEAA
ncbi:glycosyltransferase [Croceicoccus estronivorus]|uniref:glycosyltransferase n=1 Tax=Croceicoccus estronivorus TaxID=1172626 RepID=UPI0009ED0E85|nr:glycosyltransferase [Croceicoccus estronivorus]